MSFRRRLKYLLPSYRRAEERDLQEELESLRRIAGPRELGNLTSAAENARAVWGWNWLDNLSQDVRYGFRTLLHHRRVTFVALLSLALGIGANTLVFSLVNALLLRPLPYPEPDRIVLVAFHPQAKQLQTAGLTRGNCASLSGGNQVFEHFGCYTDPGPASLADYDSAGVSAVRVVGRQLTAGAADALGVKPVIGRWFTAADERQDAARVVLISFDLWQRRFSGAPDIVGKLIRFNGEAATIIGVLPDSFEFLDLVSDYWIPFQSPAYGKQSSARILGGLARLKPGTDLVNAQSHINVVAARLAEEAPEENKGWSIALRPLRRLDDETMSSEALNPIMTLQGAVAFVLLIACANVAGLLLALGTTQHKEVAVRAALGSSRRRIFRQLLTHSLLLSVAGGALGLIVGVVGLRFLTKALPAGLPRTVYQISLEPNALLFTLAVSVICGLIVGIAPALQISHAQPLDAMRESSRSATAGVTRRRLRSAFVAGQIALALMLLVGAGLMLNSLVRMSGQSLGFDPNNLLTVDIQLPEGKFRRPTGRVLLSGALEMQIDPRIYLISEQVRQNLAAVPGVTAASGIAIQPPFSGAINMPVRVEGKAAVEAQRAQFLPIMADYFKTLQVVIVQGREFTSQDSSSSVPVAVINRAMAQRYWPNENALGKQVQIESPTLPNQPLREVVGVVEEVMQYGGQNSRPQLYVPYLQLPPQHDERLSNDLRHMTFVVRTSQRGPEMMSSLRAAVALADSSQAISSIQTMRDTAFHSLQRRRVYAGLIGMFGATAVLLALVGIYGIMAQVVSQRTNEIGIRMALGADSRQVRSLVLRQGGRLIGIGLLIGTLGALALTRVLRSSLFGITATDPATFATAAVLLGGIALVACYLPARRASRIDPMMALRHE